ncbi:unnamed protein product [Fusarium graminearum]|nr:unnamed protein product [Fusarium graminearum]
MSRRRGASRFRGLSFFTSPQCHSNGKRTVGTWQLRSPDKEIVSKVKARDGNKCIITGLKSSFFDPLIVAPIPRIRNSLSKILEVFLGSDYHVLRSRPGQLDGPQNYMLARCSAAIAFSQGHFKFKFSKDPNYHVWQVWISGTDRPSILDKVPMTTRGAFKNHPEYETWFTDKSSLQKFSRFTKAIRWYHISVEIALKQQKPPPVSTALTPSFCHRLLEYSAVSTVGCDFLRRAYTDHHPALRCSGTPLGCISRRGAKKSIKIPVPRPLDIFSSSDTSYLLTTRLPGHPVGLCLDSMSEAEVDALNNELHRYLSDLRAMPKPVGIKHAICNAIGGPLRWLSMMDRVFATFGDFKDDYVTERKRWDYCM